MNITTWFNINDPYFTNPFKVLFELRLFKINELIAEYKRVFGDNWENQIDADYAAYCAVK